jgi:hypothetical protein
MKYLFQNISSSDILSLEVLSALQKGNFNLKSLIMDKFYIQKENLISMFPMWVDHKKSSLLYACSF